MKSLVILLASGQSKRMGLETPKQFQTINDQYLFEFSLQTFNNHSDVMEIVLVTSPEKVEEMKKKLHYSKLVAVIGGGQERYHSVYEGLQYFQRQHPEKNFPVLIHDSARVLVTPRIISDCIRLLDVYPAVTTSIPVDDTILLADDQVVHKTLERSTLRACQTPQGFHLPHIHTAYQHYMKQSIQKATDDTSIYQQSHPTHLIGNVMGDVNNFKVTHPQQLETLKHLIEKNVKKLLN